MTSILFIAIISGTEVVTVAGLAVSDAQIYRIS